MLVAQNARAGDDAASVVGFYAVGRIERRGQRLGSLSRFRDGVYPRVRGGSRRRQCRCRTGPDSRSFWSSAP